MNRGGKFLRPNPNGPGASYDFDESSDESDDNDNDVNEMPPPPAKRTNANLSSDDDDDSGEESEDDESDDEPSSSNKRSREETQSKSKKRSKPSFIDEEAEASDDDEEDEEYGTHYDPHDRVKKHYTDEDKRRENMDEETMAIINRQNRRRNNVNKFDTEGDVEDIARQIEERHRMEIRRVDRTVLDDPSIADGNQNLSAVTQQSLLPSVSDPNMWMVGCPTGKEQDMVYQIMNKCKEFARQGKPLGITSAVASQSKGRVFIESYSEPAVKEAVQGIRGLLVYSMRLIPINDMTTVMTVKSKKKPGTK